MKTPNENPLTSMKNVTIRSRFRCGKQTEGSNMEKVELDHESDFKLVYNDSVNTSSCGCTKGNTDSSVCNSCDKENRSDEILIGNSCGKDQLDQSKNLGIPEADDLSTPRREELSRSVRKCLIRACTESNSSYYTPKRPSVDTPTAKLYSVYKASLTGERDYLELVNARNKSLNNSLSNLEKCNGFSIGDTPRTKKVSGQKSINSRSIIAYRKKKSALLEQQSLISEDDTPRKMSHGNENSNITSDESTFNPVCSSTKFFLGPELDFPQTPACKIDSDSVLSGIKKLRTPGRLPPATLRNTFKVPSQVQKHQVEDEDDIPCTQPVLNVILRGVVAYVEVRGDDDKQDYSSCVKAQLKEMGAVISNTFTRKVTHVIFKSGRLSTYKKAREWGVKMVCVMWIEACKEAQCLVPAAGFTPSKSDYYNQKIIDESENRSNRKPRVTRARRPRKAKKQLNLDAPTNTNDADVSACEPEPKKLDMMQEFLSLAGEGIGKYFNKISNSPTSPEDICVPVSVNLLRNYLSPRKAETDVKHHMNEIEKYCKLTSCGSRRLARLLFPDNNFEDNKCEEEKDDKSSENSSLPQASNTEPSRKSAPARLTVGKKGSKQQVSIMNFLKAFDKNHQAEKKNNVNDINKKDEKNGDKQNQQKSLKNLATQETKQSSENRQIKTNNKKDKDQNVITQVSENVTVRKRKLLPLDDNIPKLDDKPWNMTDGDNHDDDTNLPTSNEYTTKYHKLKTPKTIKNPKPVSQPRKRIRMNDDEQNKENVNCSRKSSSAFFLPKTTFHKRKTPPGIVCTGIHSSEIQFVTKAVEELGVFQIENKVTANTTHVIAYHQNHRTINLLKGIARGCWIVHYEWVVNSVAAKKWLLEDPYEFTHFSPAVKKCRLERQAFGQYFSLDFFKDCGRMYVSPSSKPPIHDMKELITLCGGTVTTNSRLADLLIGGEPRERDTVFRISEKWILDSITRYSLLELDKYILSPYVEQ